MGLTSGAFEIVSAVLALAVVAAVPLLWDGGRWRLAVRSVSVVLATVLVVLAAGVFVNAQGGFYPSWAAVFGRDQVGLDGGASGVTADLSGAHGRRQVDRALAGLPRDMRPGGSALVKIQLDGRRSQISRPAALYLPAAYFSAAAPDLRFPVLEVLTGSPGSPGAELVHLRVADYLDRAIARGWMPPTVMVIPQTNASPLRDSECTDGVGGLSTDTYLTADLHDDLVRDFRVRSDRGGWALLGNSTGGYCAVNLVLRHPQWYASAVSLSGYFKPLSDVTTGNLFRGRPDVRNANDPSWTVRHWPPPPVALYLVAGDRGTEGGDMLKFAALARPPLAVTTVRIPGAGHLFSSWRTEMPPALSWLGGHLGAPQAPMPPPRYRRTTVEHPAVLAPKLPSTARQRLAR